MTRHPLDGARAKVNRAFEHLKTLNSEARKFLKTDPYGVSVDFDHDTSWYVFHARVREDPPLRLGVLVGEFAYECMSALNHAAWELAARKRGRRRIHDRTIREQVQFPIAFDPSQFRRKAIIRERHVSLRAIAAFEELQPYKGSHGIAGARFHPLTFMKEMADSDKHRVLAPAFVQVRLGGLVYVWDAPDDGVHEPLARGRQVLTDGTPLARVRFAVGNDKANVRVESQPTPEILYGAGEWAFTALELRYAHAYVTRSLDRLTELFA